MDRLSLVVLALAACAGADTPSTPPPSRVDAVAAAPKSAVKLDEFCEARPAAEEAPTFAWPALDRPAPASEGWKWVNMWATWCGPCVEEMPRLIQWGQRLAQEGAPIDLEFISVDDDVNAVTAFTKKHHWAPDGLHMAEPARSQEWVDGLGMGLAPVLPLHLFVDPAGKVRCARVGALNPDAYDSVKALVQGG